MLLKVSAACLFDENGRLLLVRKRGTQALMLPGGKPEAGEAALPALLRELEEELQLQMPAQAFQPLGQFRARAANEAGCDVLAEIYRAPLRQTVAAAAELEQLHWLEPDAAWPETLAPLLREAVLPALGWQPAQCSVAPSRAV